MVEYVVDDVIAEGGGVLPAEHLLVGVEAGEDDRRAARASGESGQVGEGGRVDILGFLSGGSPSSGVPLNYLQNSRNTHPDRVYACPTTRSRRPQSPKRPGSCSVEPPGIEPGSRTPLGGFLRAQFLFSQSPRRSGPRNRATVAVVDAVHHVFSPVSAVVPRIEGCSAEEQRKSGMKGAPLGLRRPP